MAREAKDSPNGLVAIDGRVVSADQAMVPVLDRGFLYGDSVYEVIRTYGGRPFELEEHLQRLARSAALVEIPLPVPLARLEEEILGLLHRLGTGCEWYVRVILTRGAGPIGLDPALADQPRRVIIVVPLPVLPDSLRRKGVAVTLVGVARSGQGAMPAGAKTGNYLMNIMALRRARDAGAFEAVMVDAEGFVAEGASSNVFAVSDGALLTPTLAAGILDGITRRRVIELSERAGLVVHQMPLRPGDLYGADEVFLTATIKEVLPVTSVDGRVIAQGVPGPVTERVARLFRELTLSGDVAAAPSEGTRRQ